jgi:GNAT superfamily N-acetyltransferase
MLRPGVAADIPRIFEIRHSVGENALRDPGAVTEADLLWFIDNGAFWVWQEADGKVTGVAGSDPRDGSIYALFVAPGHEGRGIGRALLKQACEALRSAGHHAAWLTTAPGTRAERHYRADGWQVTGANAKGELIFQKPL